MGEEFKLGIKFAIAAMICLTIAMFFAVTPARFVRSIWWNNGFNAGYERALQHCRTGVMADCGD